MFSIAMAGAVAGKRQMGCELEMLELGDTCRVLLIPSLTVCILLVVLHIGFLISFTVFFILENSVCLFFFSLFGCSL